MTVTWTSGYDIKEAIPFVKWALKGENQVRSPAGTLTIDRNSMCGMLALHILWDVLFKLHVLIYTSTFLAY